MGCFQKELLLFNNKYFKLSNCPIDVGISPVKSLSHKDKALRFDKEPILTGRVPEILLLTKAKCSRYGRLIISFGNGPTTLFESIRISVTCPSSTVTRAQSSTEQFVVSSQLVFQFQLSPLV